MKLALILVASAALGQAPHQHHPPRSAEEYAKLLEHSSREAWQKPHEVIEALRLGSDEVIADIGAGSGYFTRRLAQHAGKVYAVDVDEKLLAMIPKSEKIVTVHASPDDPKLPDASVDTVFFCDVLHHIDNRAAYYARLLTALKPGGRIVVIDFHKRELPVGPPVSMKLSESQVIREMSAAGLKLVAKASFLPHQYFLTFRR